jgi:alkylated DNA repair dioxygenase AlkB
MIASVSLGAQRRFAFKPKSVSASALQLVPTSVDLPHGSLLIMSGACQQHWLHQLAKTTRQSGTRINLTFRHVNKNQKL